MVAATSEGTSNTIGRKQSLGEEECEMLPLEAIGVLGLLYIFFMVGTMKALRAKKAVRPKAEVRLTPVVKDIAPETAKHTV
jgi:hypothetical protein